MTELARRTRNRDRLLELHPHFRLQIRLLIIAMEAAGFRPRIQDAWRSSDAQLAAFQTGRSKLRYGLHNVTSREGRPEALAVDLLDDDHPLDPPSEYLLQLAGRAQALGLTTGIRWGLPAEKARAIDRAVAARDWGAWVQAGSDPCHVEPVGLTVAEARRGKRPA